MGVGVWLARFDKVKEIFGLMATAVLSPKLMLESWPTTSAWIRYQTEGVIGPYMMARALFAFLPLILTGCVVLPLSSNKPEDPVADPTAVDAVVGLNQADVMQQMGTPTYQFTLGGRRFFLYETTGESTWMMLAHPLIMLGGLPPVLVQTDLEAHCVLFEFGPDDTVQGAVTKSDVVQRAVKKSDPPKLPIRMGSFCTSVLAGDAAIQGHKAELHAQAKIGEMDAANRLEEFFDDPQPRKSLLEREELRKAQLGDTEAQVRAYWNRIGSKPLIWLCRAAELGHPDACYRLAGLYELGHEGLSQDPVRAYLWFTLASEHGHAAAKNEVARLASTVLTAERLEQAKLLRSNWLPGQCEGDLHGVSDPR